MSAVMTVDAWIEEFGQLQHSDSVVLRHMQGSAQLRDLKLNLKSILEGEHLDGKERALLALSIAGNENHAVLVERFAALSVDRGASSEEVAEALACASALRANNVLYRFRHFVGKEIYQGLPARLRMNIMLKPVTGKEFFELMSLAVSAVNGCEACVQAHENSLVQLGCSPQRIWEAIRIASVVRSISLVV